MTIGAIALTRESTAATVQVVQPRFDVTSDWLSNWLSYDSFVNGALLARPFTLPKDLRSRLATLASWGAGQAVPRERRRRRSQPPADPHHPALNNTETDPTVTGTWAR